MKKPIYKPKGAAAEYGDLALNIYTGCPHRCFYCFAPQVLHRDREVFHSCVEPRRDIVGEVRRQLEREQIAGQTIHLCFTCDPYPQGCDTAPTREVIKAIKDAGNHVQILTKGDGSRDFDLLDGEDWYGVTISCCHQGIVGIKEPCTMSPIFRLLHLCDAKRHGINTWVSFEPILESEAILECIREYARFFDKVKIGKLNYHPSDIDWAQFGREAEVLCRELGLDYYIKDGLRSEMEKRP